MVMLRELQHVFASAALHLQTVSSISDLHERTAQLAAAAGTQASTADVVAALKALHLLAHLVDCQVLTLPASALSVREALQRQRSEKVRQAACGSADVLPHLRKLSSCCTLQHDNQGCLVECKKRVCRIAC